MRCKECQTRLGQVAEKIIFYVDEQNDGEWRCEGVERLCQECRNRRWPEDLPHQVRKIISFDPATQSKMALKKRIRCLIDGWREEGIETLPQVLAELERWGFIYTDHDAETEKIHAWVDSIKCKRSVV